MPTRAPHAPPRAHLRALMGAREPSFFRVGPTDDRVLSSPVFSEAIDSIRPATDAFDARHRGCGPRGISCTARLIRGKRYVQSAPRGAVQNFANLLGERV